MVRLVPVEGNPFADQVENIGEVGPNPFAKPSERGPVLDAVKSGGDTLWDVVRSGLAGVRRGAESAVGLPGDVAYGMRYLNDKARQAIGYEGNPDYVEGTGQAGNALTPTSRTVRDASTEAFGDSYEPQTTAGKFARTVGEFVPGAFVGGATAAPATLPRFLAGTAAIPGVASEAAGQATEGTWAEPWARAGGALLGGVAGGTVMNPGSLNEAQQARQGIQEAGARLGVPAMPEFMMPDALGSRVTAERLSNLPLVGAPVRQAADRTARNLGDAAEDIARDASPSGNLDMGVITHQTGRALEDYMNTAMPNFIGRHFDAVDQAITNPNVQNIPSNLRTAMRDLANAPSEAKRRINQRALNVVEADALQHGGLTYAQTKDLRSTVGAMLNDNTMPDFASMQPALKQLYGALTDDLRNAVQRSGGQNALHLWERANAQTRLAKDVGRDVQKVAGVAGDAMPDTVMARIRKLTQMRDPDTRSRLNMIRAAVEEADPAAWEDMAAAMIHDLGHNPAGRGRFDPRQFADEYHKMSREGREVLWPDADLRRSIADLAQLSDAFVDARQPSAWAAVGGVAGAGALAVANLPTALAAIGSSYTLAKLLSRPASAQKTMSFIRARLGAQASLPNAARQLAGMIAQETGEEPNDVVRRLMGKTDGRGRNRK